MEKSISQAELERRAKISSSLTGRKRSSDETRKRLETYRKRGYARPKRRNLGNCCVPGCDHKAIARELCPLHHGRLMHHGDVFHTRKLGRTKCCAYGCDRSVHCDGLCDHHQYALESPALRALRQARSRQYYLAHQKELIAKSKRWYANNGRLPEIKARRQLQSEKWNLSERGQFMSRASSRKRWRDLTDGSIRSHYNLRPDTPLDVIECFRKLLQLNREICR